MPPPTTTTDWLKPGISTLSGTLYTAYHAEHQALLVAHAQLARSLAKLKRKNKKLAATHAAALDANETLATENICLETDLRNLKIWQRREEAEERRRRAAEDEIPPTHHHDSRIKRKNSGSTASIKRKKQKEYDPAGPVSCSCDGPCQENHCACFKHRFPCGTHCRCHPFYCRNKDVVKYRIIWASNGYELVHLSEGDKVGFSVEEVPMSSGWSQEEEEVSVDSIND